MRPEVPRGKYFEELNIGDKWVSQSRIVTAADIGLYAGIGGDYYALHFDEEYAKEHGFRERISHGLLTVTMGGGFFFQSVPLNKMFMAHLGASYQLPNPVYIGDTLHAEIEVSQKRESKTKKDRGIVTFKEILKNQNDQTVLELIATIMWRRKPQN